MPRNTKLQRLRKTWRLLPPWGKVTAVTGIVIGLTGSVGGIRATWPVLRLALPALVFYVDTTLEDARGEFKNTQNTTLSVLRDMQIEQAEGKRDAAKEAKAKWSVELGKTKDSVSRDMIERHINDLDATAGKLDGQIKTLNRLRSQ